MAAAKNVKCCAMVKTLEAQVLLEPPYPVPALFRDPFGHDRENSKPSAVTAPTQAGSEQLRLSNLDRRLNYLVARATAGVSPAACANAFFDWGFHLAGSPGLQLELLGKAFHNWLHIWQFAHAATFKNTETAPAIDPRAHDNRFVSERWRNYPFNVFVQAFLLTEEWWREAATTVRGVDKQNARRVDFMIRQALDVFAPTNFVMTNPDVLARTSAEFGFNLVHGFWNFIDDLKRFQTREPPEGAEQFTVGETVAVTPGKVVFRNHLIELIQYEPCTAKVHSEPILIVPAWIMKYYILDLRPQNSLVKYLTEQGFTVFIISWRNPDASDRDTSFDDYRRHGVMAAIDAVEKITGDRKIHAAGYCLGGTLLATVASAMALAKDDRIQTLTFLAAQADFREAGELTLFIGESQIVMLEDMMAEQGFLDSTQMAGAFQLLRSNDLIWSHVVNDYLLGKRKPVYDLLAWNADATRMPYRMHSEYLRSLFLNNDFAEGRFKIEGRTVTLDDLRIPIFAVGTETDHVAPWRSVYKFNILCDAAVTFVLTSGGHNAGIVSPPGLPGRHYRLATKPANAPFVGPDEWQKKAPRFEGSWWTAWSDWLAERSSEWIDPPTADNSTTLTEAPGTYVFQR
jgi:polyhydroxyalkanoate synthase